MAYLQLAGAIGLASIAVAFFRLAYKLLRYDQIEYEKSRARYPSWMDALAGKAKVKRSDLPDGRVRAGIVYNKGKKRIETNGKLRNDLIDHIA